MTRYQANYKVIKVVRRTNNNRRRVWYKPIQVRRRAPPAPVRKKPVVVVPPRKPSAFVYRAPVRKVVKAQPSGGFKSADWIRRHDSHTWYTMENGKIVAHRSVPASQSYIPKYHQWSSLRY